MKTVLNVKTDKEIKERAQQLARHLGIPLSTIVNAQLKAFIDSGEFHVTREPELKEAVRAEIASQISAVKAGKDLSPAFKTAAEATTYLKG